MICAYSLYTRMWTKQTLPEMIIPHRLFVKHAGEFFANSQSSISPGINRYFAASESFKDAAQDKIFRTNSK